MAQKPVILITAAASGIGAVMAKQFVEAGYKVVVGDVDADSVRAFLHQNPQISGGVMDVSDPDSIEAFFTAWFPFGSPLDVLINNAGIAGPTASVKDISIEEWNQTLAVDLSGAFYVTRKAAPLMQAAQAGAIINISSNAGLFGFPNRLPYAVSKWGLIGMTKTLAMELGPDGIRVNALCPGSVSGDRIDHVIKRDAQLQGVSESSIRQLYSRQSSMRCFVEPEDIAAMAVFLASSAGAKISGQVIAVDGHTESLSSIDELRS